ncbi:hypothetical protein [Amycolatopsis sp. NPDC001319]|uniref:hypothetical protein n=1 Tax=unclassified Amycolatopsis TaxID=2618356 RepID=UPI00369FD7D2
MPEADPIIRAKTRDSSVLHCNTVHHTICGQLAGLTSLSTSRIHIHDVFAQVKLEQDAAARARELARMRHELALDELARRQARARAHFIRDECLADPATARIYTLLEKSSRLGDLSQTLRDDLISEVAQWHKPARPVLIAQEISAFFARLTPEQAYGVVDHVCTAMRGYGAPEQADRLRNLNTPPGMSALDAAAQADLSHAATSTQSTTRTTE